MSGRLEEMPGEEGYPAYLGSRLAQFYERAGRVIALGSDGREGALSVIGAVSPAGGDISEPVSQATLRIVKVFWGLDAQLAYARHFPAINWLTSYSLYADSMSAWYNRNVEPDWTAMRDRIMLLLHEENELQEIVQLVGMDALSPADRLKLEAARSIREDFLHQDAFHEVDTYSPLIKQYAMLSLVLLYYDMGVHALEKGVSVGELVRLPAREAIGRFKYLPNEQVREGREAVEHQLNAEISALFTALEERDR
jgi:V/A-type H+-transporting ATPase subunit A